MSGLVLRLAAPLQAWGEHSAFSDRDTLRFPTRSGLIGLFAAAQGLRRGEPLDRYDKLSITVRIDRPGVIINDFHTIGGGARTRNATVPTADGGRRSPQAATIVTRRHYLSDAVFVVAVDGSDDVTRPLAQALVDPFWPPYLGRRSCPPDQPLLLRSDVADPVKDITERVPVARRQPDPDSEKNPKLDFVAEGARMDATTVTEVSDVPVGFARLNRRYRTRSVSITPRPVPQELWPTHTFAYRKALQTYMEIS